MLELSPQDTRLQPLSQHGTDGETGMRLGGVQGGNREITES